MPLFGGHPEGVIEAGHTWAEAEARWLDERRKKRSLIHDITKFDWFRPYFGTLLLHEISSDLIAAVIRVKADQTSSSTANRYIALVHAVLNRAYDLWGWLDAVPKVARYEENEPRDRWLTPEQAQRLRSHLPDYLQGPFSLSLATGLRQSNVFCLEWSEVHWPSKTILLSARRMKGRAAHRVPLNQTALEVLAKQKDQHPRYVFTYRGRPFSKINRRDWRRALEAAGIDDFRWHDLRHTWAAWLAQAGTPMQALQELGGWRSQSVLKRYTHFSPTHLASYMEKLSSLLPST